MFLHFSLFLIADYAYNSRLRADSLTRKIIFRVQEMASSGHGVARPTSRKKTTTGNTVAAGNNIVVGSFSERDDTGYDGLFFLSLDQLKKMTGEPP